MSLLAGGVPGEAGDGAGEGHGCQRGAAQPPPAGEPAAGAQVGASPGEPVPLHVPQLPSQLQTTALTGNIGSVSAESRTQLRVDFIF